MDDALNLLEGGPLVDVQTDGGKLRGVLQTIIKDQQQLAQRQEKLGQHLASLEKEMQLLYTRQRSVEKTIESVEGNSKQQLHMHVDDMNQRHEALRNDLKRAFQMSEEAARMAGDLKRVAQLLERELVPQQQLHDRAIASLASEVTQRHQELFSTVDKIRLDLMNGGRQMQSTSGISAASIGEADWGKLCLMLDDLSGRTDRNFRSVEESALAVDAELARHRSDISSIRTELHTLKDELNQLISVSTRGTSL
ncbi:hypothetical protein ERJ75_000957700 [Trypanosoma vivax]|uniref:Uncharacterized protein n=1 Tax=Trypanosoma vivax (strain Y486) TaxID=1055687 RepID=G0U4S4_TRYVY|nr:hypothetical protein TRVL_02738 [Trypanosoma vivax]KAH8611700.1 hypothetical protein ERJ75_000957700 [Trypanosoma vivax]CCC52439.1 conserved hypothetical protein [Trypanosoma vivax Y486]